MRGALLDAEHRPFRLELTAHNADHSGAALCGLPQQCAWPASSRRCDGAFPVVEKLVGEEFFAGDGAGIRDSASAALAAARTPMATNLPASSPRSTGARASLSCRRGAARGRAHPRLSCGGRHAACPPTPSRPSIPMRCRTLRLDAASHRSQSSARRYPIVTIWAMNSGELRARPDRRIRRRGRAGRSGRISTVEVRALPPGGAAFLQALAGGLPLARCRRGRACRPHRFRSHRQSRGSDRLRASSRGIVAPRSARTS